VRRARARAAACRRSDASTILEALFGVVQHDVFFVGQPREDRKIEPMMELILGGAERRETREAREAREAREGSAIGRARVGA